jgi:hypothetical protein
MVVLRRLASRKSLQSPLRHVRFFVLLSGIIRLLDDVVFFHRRLATSAPAAISNASQ